MTESTFADFKTKLRVLSNRKHSIFSVLDSRQADKYVQKLSMMVKLDESGSDEGFEII